VQLFRVCICSLRYPTCNTIAPYCHMCSAKLYSIFPHYLINGTFFEKKKVIEHEMCFDFLYKFVRNIFHSKKNWARYDQKVCWSACKVHVILVIFLKTWIFWTDVLKIIKFHENPFIGSRVVRCGQTDGQTWQSLIVAFRNFASSSQIDWIHNASSCMKQAHLWEANTHLVGL